MGGNMMVARADYYAFERLVYEPSALSTAGPWDLLLSAFDETERVTIPFERIAAQDKVWFMHEEYGLESSAHPPESVSLRATFNPPDLVQFIEDRASELRDKSICVDSTGFIRPHLLVLLRALRDIGIHCFDVLYSDPERYMEDENTEFIVGPLLKVEQVAGYEGLHRSSMTSNDILVIGAGYDYEQLARACDAKRHSKKYVLTGLPSLQPHMYQESVLRIDEAMEWIGSLTPEQWLYASASHPFAVAQVLHDVMAKEGLQKNLYLCPIGPKPHLVGFALYYLRELEGQSASVIYPFAERYRTKTSEGLMRTWQYRIEF